MGGRARSIDLIDVALAVGASTVLVASQGEVVLVAIALAALAARPWAAVAVLASVASTAVRWGTTELGAIAGAQAVVGPAGWTGDLAPIASTWLAALAMVLVASAPSVRPALRLRPDRIQLLAALPAIPFGLAAAAIATGPGPGGALAVRVVGSALLCAAAVLVANGAGTGIGTGVGAGAGEAGGDRPDGPPDGRRAGPGRKLAVRPSRARLDQVAAGVAVAAVVIVGLA